MLSRLIFSADIYLDNRSSSDIPYVRDLDVRRKLFGRRLRHTCISENKGRVRQAESKLVRRSLVVEVKRTVVDDVALLEVELRDSTVVVVVVEDVSAVVFPVLADGPGKLCSGVHTTE